MNLIDQIIGIIVGIIAIVGGLYKLFVWIKRRKQKNINHNSSVEKLSGRKENTINNIVQNTDRPNFSVQYFNLFHISSLNIPYVTIFGGWQKGSNEYRRAEVTSKTDDYIYHLPKDFLIHKISDYTDDLEPKCRLLSYDCEITAGSLPNKLTFTFSKVKYDEYLMSGEHLDDHLPGDPVQTFRNKYAPSLELQDFGESKLTNICGVGIFILTNDDKIIIAKHSGHVKVFSNVWSYSASGTMDWKDNVHPFDEVARECFEEIGHEVNMEDVYLFGFGIDAKKLYFQFSFFENSCLTSDEIISKAPFSRDYSAEVGNLIAIPYDLDEIVKAISQYSWEPAAEAGLLTLCSKKFGINAVEKAINPEFVQKRVRQQMKAEWDNRALRPQETAVMSTRYPFQRCAEESKKYIQNVIDFIGDDVHAKDVLEIGCGIGRLSKWLVNQANHLTCIDISERMLERNKKLLGALSEKVKYHNMFAQDYKPKKIHDIVISSLVLIHNIDDDAFYNMIDVMSKCAEAIFLFEHTDEASQVSVGTHPRTEQELTDAFSEYRVIKRKEYVLFNDNLIFLKLIRKT